MGFSQNVSYIFGGFTYPKCKLHFGRSPPAKRVGILYIYIVIYICVYIYNDIYIFIYRYILLRRIGVQWCSKQTPNVDSQVIQVAGAPL